MNRHLWVRLLPDRVVINVATLGPLGNIKPAPGTWGSLAGIVWFVIAYWNLNYLASLLFALLSMYVAIQFCWEAEIRLGLRDPGKIVLDEFVAIPFCFVGLDRFLHTDIGWVILLLGFLFFRLFDVWKPLGIRKLQDYPGGIGVVIDDVVAAFATCVVLYVIVISAYYGGLLEKYIA
ncbi:MAG: phosphatidylglycerophosphatase A [Verrucomicrobiae bacterium]|nr:phosphatidylglycerophosphatase A [Verrucomicrobiae bacterium]